MKPYSFGRQSGRNWGKIGLFFLLFFIILVVGGYLGIKQLYEHNLRPVNPDASEQITFTISSGTSPGQVAESLKDKQLIRSPQAFVQYVKRSQLAADFKAGTYRLSQAMSVQDIVKVITEGSVADDLFTIYPGNNLEQIKALFLENTHYTELEIAQAFDPNQYADHPLLKDIPAGSTLEGFIYPDSYQFVSSTTPQTIIRQALDEMYAALNADIRAGIAAQGLSIYEGITLASIVEREVGDRDVTGQPNDNRAKAAQVFLKRLEIGMMLQSNATDNYPESYDTYSIPGLPPGPISNVTVSSLQAVAQPAATNFLFFVAGKDCVTRFSETEPQHEELKSAHGIATPEDKCRG